MKTKRLFFSATVFVSHSYDKYRNLLAVPVSVTTVFHAKYQNFRDSVFWHSHILIFLSILVLVRPYYRLLVISAGLFRCKVRYFFDVRVIRCMSSVRFGYTWRSTR